MTTREGPSGIEMRHLRLMAAISVRGSLTAAAASLRLTQPALSHQLRELEMRLRTPLFVRTSRRMVPTPAGEQLTRIARGVLAQVQEFERQAAGGRFDEPRGVLRLATECHTAYHWLPGVLRSFQARWPFVDLRIAPEFTSAPLVALHDGSLDVAIVHSRSADRRFRFDPLLEDELVAVVAPGHPWARRPFVVAQDFASEHFIMYSSADGTTTVSRQLLDPAGVVPRRVTRIQLTEAILQLVGAGLGVSVVSRWALGAAGRSGVVAAVRLTEQGFRRKWFAAVRAADPAPGFLFDFLGLLREQLVRESAGSEAATPRPALA
jgi:LysR family transcriptional regulator for metE and metH